MKKFKILYVDDEFINLELFEISLGIKYHVFTAHNGIAGLQVVEENPDIKVVISDMKMPIMNGLEFLRKLCTKHSEISCFLLTGYGLTPEINEAIREGLILDCMSKPFEMELIDKEIQRVLNK
ncbi:MAG: response regulator [Bacteroidales bacterium]|nr:response regulator [Bacteroidales bacterium]